MYDATRSQLKKLLMADDNGLRLVDDLYWLEKAASLVDGAVALKKESADRLATAAGWLASIFALVITTFFATRVATLDRLALVSCIVTVILIVSAYITSLHAGSVQYRDFDPRMPDQVSAAYRDLAISISTRLRLATLAMILAAVAVACSIALVGSRSTPDYAPQATVRINSLSDATDDVVVTGRIPNTQAVTIVVQRPNGLTSVRSVAVGPSGKFAELFTAAPASQYNTRIEWTDSKGSQLILLMRSVK